MTSDAHTDLSKAVYVLNNAQRICILTGAGISAESGIPTFRDKQTGLWENFLAEDLANCDSFVRDPELVWSWYQWRRSEVKDKRPNPAHEALATWQAQAGQLGQTISLITQNVDDLHEQAGSQATHLHGELWQNHCSECGQAYKEAIDPAVTALVPCKSCGGKVRPSIVWFGEMLPQEPWQIAQQAAENCEVFISIGTSSMVYPAARLAQSAKQNGATVIEINPQPTDNGLVDIQLPYPAGEILPELVAQLSQAKN